MLSWDWNNLLALVNIIILVLGGMKGAALFKFKIDKLISERETDHVANQTRLKALETELEKFARQLESVAKAMIQLATQETRLNAIDQRFSDVLTRLETLQANKPAPIKKRRVS